jgi:hypothetical protein
MAAHYALCVADYVRFMAGWGFWGTDATWSKQQVGLTRVRCREGVSVDYKKGFGTGNRNWPLNDGQIPNFRE